MSTPEPPTERPRARDQLVMVGVAMIGVVALGAGLWAAEIQTRAIVEAQALATAVRITEAASDVLDLYKAEDPSPLGPELREGVLTLLRRISNVQRMVAIDTNSRVWLDSENAVTGIRESDEDIASVLEGGNPLSLLNVTQRGLHVLGISADHTAIAEVYVPVRRDGRIVGAFEFYIDMTDQLTEASRIARSNYFAFASAIAAGMAAILAVVWTSLHRRRRDIQALDSMRRRAEAVSEKLAEANRHQARFNANAAHELRTPLSILKARLDSMNPDEDVLALSRDVENMTRQVGLLLEFARTETGSLEPARLIDLVETARDIVAQIYPIFRKQARGIVMRAPEHPVHVLGDTALLHSALRNLLENALRVSPKGADVEVTIVERPPSVSVGDRGPGLDPDDLPELTEPFRRGRDGGSAGLGLAIVAEAAKHLKATLRLTRNDGGGATFSLVFGDDSPTS